MNICIKKKIAIAFFALLCTGVTTSHLQAQVTVGSNIEAAKAALLEIKSEEQANPTSVTDASNITSRVGGLVLPRVQLVSNTTLQPFIATTDTEWNSSNIDMTKRKHAGLIVYNLATTGGFKPGVYVWDGAKWKLAGDEGMKYFYAPSFNIEMDALGTATPVDLYQEYAKQFQKSGNSTFVCSNNAIATIPAPINGSIYGRTELDYAITYYDSTVFDNVAITDQGVLSYDVKSLMTSPDTFMNVIFIVK